MATILKESVLVKELQDDMIENGLLVKYDDSSPFMYGMIKNGNSAILEKLRQYIPYGNIIVSFYRVNKTPYRGLYVVDYNNILEVMSEEEYKHLLGK